MQLTRYEEDGMAGTVAIRKDT